MEHDLIKFKHNSSDQRSNFVNTNFHMFSAAESLMQSLCCDKMFPNPPPQKKKKPSMY
jgi:hypothetical protein